MLVLSSAENLVRRTIRAASVRDMSNNHDCFAAVRRISKSFFWSFDISFIACLSAKKIIPRKYSSTRFIDNVRRATNAITHQNRSTAGQSFVYRKAPSLTAL